MTKKPRTPEVAKENPALATTLSASVVTLILGLLVTHHVIGSAHVGSLTAILAPLVAAALPAAAGAIVHHKVMPMTKIEAVIAARSHGMLTDADVARIGAAVLEHLERFDGELLIGAEHPDAERVGAPSHPTRQAGRPGADTF